MNTVKVDYMDDKLVQVWTLVWRVWGGDNSHQICCQFGEEGKWVRRHIRFSPAAIRPVE